MPRLPALGCARFHDRSGTLLYDPESARYAHLGPEHRVAALEKLFQPTATTTATAELSTSKTVAHVVQ